MSYAIVTLIGNVGRDAEITYTMNGNAKCVFSVATSHGKKDDQTTTWRRVTVWGKQAETLAQYLTKGKQVFISGREELSEWQGRDGVVKQTLEVVATEVQLLGERGAARAATAHVEAPAKMETVDEEDIPF